MWELRLFSRKSLDDSIPDEITNPLNNKVLERRTDFYYKLDILSYGLKERWYWYHNELQNPLFELKVLHDKDPYNVEFWDKIVKEPVLENIHPVDGLEQEDIIAYIRNSNISKEIKNRIVARFKGGTIRRIPIQKKRRQVDIGFDGQVFYEATNTSLEEQFIFEKTDIKVYNRRLYTYIIESANINLIHDSFNQVFGREVLKENAIMGYPEFLQSL